MTHQGAKATNLKVNKYDAVSFMQLMTDVLAYDFAAPNAPKCGPSSHLSLWPSWPSAGRRMRHANKT